MLFDVKAVPKELYSELTEVSVRATLQALLGEVRDGALRRGEQIDGVSAFLYISRDHMAGGSMALGLVEWWPKGHSFGPDNVNNIENKATYVEEIDVWDFALPETTRQVVARIPKSMRRAIFTALVRSEDRADRDAEAKYPLDGRKLAVIKLSRYELKSRMEKNLQEQERLEAKYKRALLKKYAITKEELDKIRKEAWTEKWPLPVPVLR